MTKFNHNTVEFTYIPSSKISLPTSANVAKLFINERGSLSLLYFNGDIKELGEAAQVQQVIEAYDDSFLRTQIKQLSEQLPSFVTSANLANEIALILKTVDQEKNDVVAQIAALETSLVALGEAKSLDLANAEKQLRGFFVEQLVAAETALNERIDKATSAIPKLQEFISTLAESLGNLSKNILANNVVLESRTKLLEAVTKEEIAKLRGELPIVVAGSSNVSVEKTGNVYSISVSGTDKLIERITERVGGGGISKSAVQKMIDEALIGYTPGAGGTTIVSSDGSVIVTEVSAGYYDLSTATSGNGVLAGEVTIDGINSEYTIPHIQVNTDLAIPVVAYESDSGFNMLRVHDRLYNQFKVTTYVVGNAGDKILWHMNYSPFIDYIVLGDEFNNEIVTETGDTILI